MVSVCGFSFTSSTSGGPSSGWLPDRCGHVDDRLNDVLLAEGGGKNSAVLEDIEREEEGGNNTAEEPTDAISVRMSIWRDLCAGHQADERQVTIIEFFKLLKYQFD